LSKAFQDKSFTVRRFRIRRFNYLCVVPERHFRGKRVPEYGGCAPLSHDNSFETPFPKTIYLETLSSKRTFLKTISLETTIFPETPFL